MRDLSLVSWTIRHRRAALLDRPVDHRTADPLPTQGFGHPHRLDLPAPGALEGDSGNEGELHRPDHHAALLGDDLALVGVGGDEVEGPLIRPIERQRRILALLAQRVFGEQGDDGRQVGEGRIAEHYRPVHPRGLQLRARILKQGWQLSHAHCLTLTGESGDGLSGPRHGNCAGETFG